MAALSAVDAEGRNEAVDLDMLDTPDAAIRLRRSDGSVEDVTASDLFECLIKVRLLLESHGLLLCCQEARPNVFPSGLNRQMSNGRLAYPLRRMPPLTDDDLVDIFKPAEPSEVGTVEQQMDFVRSFYGFGAEKNK
jgi:hypothetical protein